MQFYRGSHAIQYDNMFKNILSYWRLVHGDKDAGKSLIGGAQNKLHGLCFRLITGSTIVTCAMSEVSGPLRSRPTRGGYRTHPQSRRN
jgi:hypothetical protein